MIWWRQVGRDEGGVEEGEGDEGFLSETPTRLQMKWKPVLEGEEGKKGEKE